VVCFESIIRQGVKDIVSETGRMIASRSYVKREMIQKSMIGISKIARL
jgi:hypothetical protein